MKQQPKDAAEQSIKSSPGSRVASMQIKKTQRLQDPEHSATNE